jgi:hypothetical protein
VAPVLADDPDDRNLDLDQLLLAVRRVVGDGQPERAGAPPAVPELPVAVGRSRAASTVVGLVALAVLGVVLGYVALRGLGSDSGPGAPDADLATDADVASVADVESTCADPVVPLGSLADDPVSLTCPTIGEPQDVALDVFVPGTSLGARASFAVAGGPADWSVDLATDSPDDAHGVVLIRGPAADTSTGGVRAEFGVVVGHDDYRDVANLTAYEIVITSSDEPGAPDSSAFEAAEFFPGASALTCRVALSGEVGCWLKQADGQRAWGTSPYAAPDGVDAPPEGGLPSDEVRYLSCDRSSVKADCLDRITVAFVDGTLTVLLNDQVLFRQRELGALPDDLLEGDVATWWAVATARPGLEQLRLHGSR